ncbi:MAG: deoxyribose-phosphate aldolase [Gammaproteobacteria bacterium]|nr:deoxyribose-phosphate aldolase [Gammaproteobacteria bacterium]
MEAIAPTPQWLKRILSLMDLTSLNSSDTKESIAALCQKAVTPNGHVAAVCCYPEFVSEAAAALKGTPVKIATVANFPLGTDYMQDVLANIRDAIALGANEVDVVFPYERYLGGERALAKDLVRECKKVCGKDVILKVILETGVLNKPSLIADASKAVIEAGADFIKTSTGKAEVGATLMAAAVILLTIKEMEMPVGLKVAGGIREVEDALEYIDLANKIMGSAWVTPQRFRIGASQLIERLG